MPSLTDVAFLMPAGLLFGRLEGARTLLADGDTGWHIRAGEWMLDHHQVARQDFFSFTRAGRPWFAWEWLADVGMAHLYRWGGLAAAVLAALMVLSVTFALLYRLVRARSGNALISIALVAVAVAGSSIHWLARPHLVTLLFTVLFLGILESRRARLLALLPPLMVLWTNLHGGFVAGLLLLAAYAVGTRRRPYVLAALASLAATFCNPYFYRLHAHLWQYLAGDGWQFRHIREFVSLSFQHPAAIFFELMLMLGMAAAFWHLRQRRFPEVLLLVGWSHLALVAARNIPIFLIVAAPAVGLALAEWLEVARHADLPARLRSALAGFARVARETGATDRQAWIPATSLAAALILAMLFYRPAPGPKLRAEYDPKAFPVRAVATLGAPAGQRIFTSDQWGDYLIYRLYPGIRVFVDGRSDFYGSGLEQTYLDVMNVRYDWQDRLDGFGIDTVLVAADAPLAGALKQARAWRVVYDDGVAIVFRRAAAEGEPVSAGRNLVAGPAMKPGLAGNPQVTLGAN